jgi:hypothetical protein
MVGKVMPGKSARSIHLSQQGMKTLIQGNVGYLQRGLAGARPVHVSG